VFTAPDAVVVAAVCTGALSQLATWRSSRKAERAAVVERAQLANEFQNNDGKTMRDAIDRIETTIRHDVVPRLDHGAGVLADHSDRLAALEAHRKSTRNRKAETA